jgi:hypothetical protein
MIARLLATTSSALSLACLAGCMTPPPDHDLSMQRPTRDKKVVVALQPPAINQIHSWQVKLSTPDGAPVR